MSRNPRETRGKLVKTAYEQMHKHGFQGMRVDQVLKQTGLKKGGFYHHFSSKTELGYAVVEEEIRALLEAIWINPINSMNNPVTDIPLMIETLDDRTTKLMREHGCPLNNLALEMSNLDEGFRKRIDENFNLWIDALTKKLDEAKNKKYIRQDIDSEVVARFVIAVIEGCISITKVEKTKQQSAVGVSQISDYLKSLELKG